MLPAGTVSQITFRPEVGRKLSAFRGFRGFAKVAKKRALFADKVFLVP